jgi:hypothetical protein
MPVKRQVQQQEQATNEQLLRQIQRLERTLNRRMYIFFCLI